MEIESCQPTYSLSLSLNQGEGRTKKKSENSRDLIAASGENYYSPVKRGRKDGMKRAFKVYGQERVALGWRGDVEQKRRPARTKVEKVAFIPAAIFPVKYEKERRKGLDGKEEEVSAF